jgi:phosphotriesterase-related protein
MRRVEPYLRRVREAGCRTLVECTPAYLGRDPELLRRLAQATDLQILTNTGYYGAASGKYLPPQAHSESSDQLAQRWIAEWRDGIDQSGIKPGFIKIGVDGGPLNEVNRKLIEAAARTHQATGLTIAAHTGNGVAAQEQFRILRSENAKPSAWIWVHAQMENDLSIHRELAEAGAWIEFDGIAPDSIDRHVELVQNMKRHMLLDRVLISQDAGWYWVGEPEGGSFRAYDTLFTLFLPALRAAGFTEEEVQQLTVENPAQAGTPSSASAALLDQAALKLINEICKLDGSTSSVTSSAMPSSTMTSSTTGGISTSEAVAGAVEPSRSAASRITTRRCRAASSAVGHGCVFVSSLTFASSSRTASIAF